MCVLYIWDTDELSYFWVLLVFQCVCVHPKPNPFGMRFSSFHKTWVVFVILWAGWGIPNAVSSVIHKVRRSTWKRVRMRNDDTKLYAGWVFWKYTHTHTKEAMKLCCYYFSKIKLFLLLFISNDKWDVFVWHKNIIK